MNRYPLWKYIIIAIALSVGLIYALPNFFAEVPAVQVSSSHANAVIDSTVLTTVEGTLKQSNLNYRGVSLDATGIKVRFNDFDDQRQARDALKTKLGDNYIVALTLLSTSPEWLTSIGALPMYLGLDLRGGIYLLLQVDMEGGISKTLDRYGTDLRTLMRDQKIQYAGVLREGKTVVLRFRDEQESKKALAQMYVNDKDLQVKEAGGPGEYRLIATLSPQAEVQIKKSAIEQNLTVLRKRLNETGVSEPIIQQQGEDRIVVQVPGVQDSARIKDLIGRTATLEIRMVNEDAGSLEAAQSGNVPFGSDLFIEPSGQPILVKRLVVLTGDRITDAQPGFDQRSNEPAVHIRLDGGGSRIWRDVTKENVGKRMAIVLVEKGKVDVITAPVIREEISGGQMQISGHMNTREANDIALLMRAGALAAPMEIIEERSVGPSLGKDNIDKGFHSTLYGFIAISVFMCCYYLLFGGVSTLSLAVNLFLLVAVLSMLQATLTLPGIAAVALTLGMAIDSNVLINERIREELRNGATPQAAISAGYERAFNTIVDSNITTLIAGLALLTFGSGPVRGFAVVHCLGIMTSMFSAVFVSRGIVNFIYGARKKLDKLSIGQVWTPTAQVQGKRALSPKQGA